MNQQKEFWATFNQKEIKKACVDYGLNFDDFRFDSELMQTYGKIKRQELLSFFNNDYRVTNESPEELSRFALFLVLQINVFNIARRSDVRLAHAFQALEFVGLFSKVKHIKINHLPIFKMLAKISEIRGLYMTNYTSNQKLDGFSMKYDPTPKSLNIRLFPITMGILMAAYDDVDIDVPLNDEGDTLLMLLTQAAEGDYSVRCLLDLGADPHLENKHGLKAVHRMKMSAIDIDSVMKSFLDMGNERGMAELMFESKHYQKIQKLQIEKDSPTVTLQCTSAADECLQYLAINKKPKGTFLSQDIIDYLTKGLSNQRSIECLNDSSLAIKRNRTVM